MVRGIIILSWFLLISCAAAPKCKGPKDFVDIAFKVNESGSPYDIKIVKSAEHALDSAALETASKMKFDPEKMTEIKVGQLLKRRFEFQECEEKK